MMTDEDPTVPLDRSTPEGIPSRIGPYVIKRKIASGGMGTIYEGLQENPRRPVAVKVMRRGVVSPDALRRFKYESQILARLRHPGIAQVYEAGTYGEGEDTLPFFAMEYIPNAKALTQYADDKKLDAVHRLKLFANICDAVHHGHLKGIVHRDLKPSNILVDSQGNSRIIDFGVARVTDSDVALAAAQTEVGQLIGSLQYMSPEQFEADPHDIDTRSDVYTLGVVLYELLRGKLPYNLAKTSLHEASRIVREDDPPRLSDGKPALKGDIETIVQTAMEKDRDRRYQSAFGLAQDIRRYQKGETIMARPPSMTYQFQVFARRNKGLIGSVIAVFVVLVAGVATSTALFFQAQGQREVAETQTAKANAANDFLREMIKEAIPLGYGEKSATIAEMLDLSRDRAPKAFADEPVVEAEICRTLGWGYLKLTRTDESYEQLSRAYELRRGSLGENHPATLESMYDMARIFSILGRNQEAVDMNRKIVSIMAAENGDEHQFTLKDTYGLALSLADLGHMDEAEELVRTLGETCDRVLGDRHLLTLQVEILRAGLRLLRGEEVEAEKSSRALLSKSRSAFGEEHEVTRSARSQLAATLISQGKIKAAAEIYKNRRIPDDLGILTRFQGVFNPNHQGTQVLVFWESWCPFSQRTIPKMEDTYQRYRFQDLDVIGITQVNRTATNETVKQFIKEKGITFPIVKVDGQLNKYFGQTGTPFFTVLKDGVMVWENYVDTPEKIPTKMIEGLLAVDGGGNKE